MRKIEVVANICIICVSLLIGGVYAGNIWRAHHHAVPLKAGDRSPVKFGADSTLVLVLQEGCGYCKASAPFYRSLLTSVKGESGIHVAALLPQPINRATRYLRDDLGIAIDDVRQLSLPALRVQGTPTLLLINSTGIITKVWTGQLQSAQEIEVFQNLKNAVHQ